ncbi:hypothetical protein HGRIS_006561 [Hohenbuehelia grisea]|uniref:Uncharacterized protein n=1 Tax=Hohenbuehelia grisea TaxID=104357 RepID=A0ABR3JAF0_9AGAR
MRSTLAAPPTAFVPGQDLEDQHVQLQGGTAIEVCVAQRSTSRGSHVPQGMLLNLRQRNHGAHAASSGKLAARILRRFHRPIFTAPWLHGKLERPVITKRSSVNAGSSNTNTNSTASGSNWNSSSRPPTLTSIRSSPSASPALALQPVPYHTTSFRISPVYTPIHLQALSSHKRVASSFHSSPLAHGVQDDVDAVIISGEKPKVDAVEAHLSPPRYSNGHVKKLSSEHSEIQPGFMPAVSSADMDILTKLSSTPSIQRRAPPYRLLLWGRFGNNISCRCITSDAQPPSDQRRDADVSRPINDHAPQPSTLGEPFTLAPVAQQPPAVQEPRLSVISSASSYDGDGGASAIGWTLLEGMFGDGGGQGGWSDDEDDDCSLYGDGDEDEVVSGTKDKEDTQRVKIDEGTPRLPAAAHPEPSVSASTTTGTAPPSHVPPLAPPTTSSESSPAPAHAPLRSSSMTASPFVAPSLRKTTRTTSLAAHAVPPAPLHLAPRHPPQLGAQGQRNGILGVEREGLYAGFPLPPVAPLSPRCDDVQRHHPRQMVD